MIHTRRKPAAIDLQVSDSLQEKVDDSRLAHGCCNPVVHTCILAYEVSGCLPAIFESLTKVASETSCLGYGFGQN